MMPLNEKITKNTYDPNHLLDKVIDYLELKNDFALSLMLDVSPSTINNMRRHHISIGATMLIKLHEITGFSIKELRAMMNDHNEKFSRYEIKKPGNINFHSILKAK